jgi:dienelactone hydrolase
MKRFAFGALLIGLRATPAVAAPLPSDLADNGKPYSEVAADPAAGFNYPYILFTPPHSDVRCNPYLIVETNNPYAVKPAEEMPEARRAAIKVATHRYLGNVMAQRLGTTVLVPEFPRPLVGADSDLDTGALSRQALLAAPGRLKRLDLQLIAMIDDARARLTGRGRELPAKILMTGFSASGIFASRFVFLHPDRVAAAAFGGLNAFIMLPVAELDGKALEYPVGLADYAAIIGHGFDRAAWARVPQLAFMGENDTNDGVPNDDMYTAEETNLVFTLIGKKMLPDRWAATQARYRTEPNSVQFKTYSDIGHDFDERVYADVESLFEAVVHGAAYACR